MSKYRLLFLFIICSCTTDVAKQHVKVEPKVDGSLKIIGLDPAIIQAIVRDTMADKWQNLFPVYKIPKRLDSEDYQPPQPGNYTVAGDAILFAPDTPFVKGNSYYIRLYLYEEGTSMWDIISKKNKLGQYRYNDILFEPQYLKNK
ncbi:hypothetical protein [Mucilaginibacter hurinus]|nr:hypothetical protein [Mucilaginibacter hurinus]